MEFKIKFQRIYTHKKKPPQIQRALRKFSTSLFDNRFKRFH